MANMGKNPHNPRVAAAGTFVAVAVVGGLLTNFAAASDVETDVVWLMAAVVFAGAAVASSAAWAGSTVAELNWWDLAAKSERQAPPAPRHDPLDPPNL